LRCRLNSAPAQSIARHSRAKGRTWVGIKLLLLGFLI